MSKATEVAYENAKQSTFQFLNGNKIEVTNASILWPDFTGRVTKYHKNLGEKRSFNLVLNDDMVKALADLQARTGAKFGIRQANVYSENDIQSKGVQQIVLYYINVKVNMESQIPPIVNLFTEFNGKVSKTTLNAATIGQLDSIDMENVGVVINCYTNQFDPERCTAYLTKLYVKQSPQTPEFNGMFDIYNDEDGSAAPVDCINPATGEVY